MIPALKQVIDVSTDHGVENITIGMPHRYVQSPVLTFMTLNVCVFIGVYRQVLICLHWLRLYPHEL